MRNTSQEEALYFTQWNHLFLPTAGLVEGFHQLRIRMAQGQLQSLHVNIPASWTIADVWGDVGQGWRFDPEASGCLCLSKVFQVRIWRFGFIPSCRFRLCP